MQELSSAEKRELQQIILKKAKMSQDEEALIKKLSLVTEKFIALKMV